MNCQQNLGLFENGALDGKANTVCVGCQEMLKEIAMKDKLIVELQEKLDSIHQISATGKCGLPKDDLSQKFQITSFNLGVGVKPAAQRSPYSTDSDSSSSGLPEGNTLGHHVVHRGHTTTSSSSELLQLFQQRGDFSEQGGEQKLVTVQEIIDKVIEKSPKEGKGVCMQPPANDHYPDKIITIQEIIDNIVEKSGKV